MSRPTTGARRVALTPAICDRDTEKQKRGSQARNAGLPAGRAAGPRGGKINGLGPQRRLHIACAQMRVEKAIAATRAGNGR